MIWNGTYFSWQTRKTQKQKRIEKNKQKTSELKHRPNEFDITELLCTERSLIEDKLPSIQCLKILPCHPTHTLETSIFLCLHLYIDGYDGNKSRASHR